MVISLSLIPLVFFHWFLFPVTFQEKENQTEAKPTIHHEVVVTATRLETQAFKVGNSMTIISGQELRNRGFVTVAEALTQLPSGFLTRNGGPGSAASFLLRGANSEHTLILIDGVEINDPISPSRSCDLSQLFLFDVDRIEIFDGPHSPLYGSDAMGGVINIVLKKRAPGRLSVSSEAGSFKTINFNLSMSGQAKGLSYNLAASEFSSQGISAASSSYPGNQESDGYRNTSFSGQINYPITPRLEIGCLFRYVNSKTDLDNFGGPYGDDPNYYQRWQSSFLKLSLHSFPFNKGWEQKIYFAFISNHRQNNNNEDDFHPGEKERGKYKSLFLKLDWQNNFYLKKDNVVTIGLEAEKEEGESTYVWSSLWGEDKSIFPRKNAFSMGLYLQEHFSLASCLFTTAGLRLDHHARSGLALTYRLAQSFWWERTSTKLRASLATGFKSPSLYQLYAPATMWGPIGNANLKPEETFSWDIGFEQDFPKFLKTLSLTYFRHFFRHLIQFDYFQGYQNIGRARTSGLKLQGKFQPFSCLNLNFSWGWLEALDLTSKEKLLRRPDFQGKIEIELNPYSRWRLLASLWRVSSREDMDYSQWPAERVILSPFFLANINLIYEFRPGFSFHLRLENVTNSQYELIKGYGTPGFSFYTGLSLTI